MGQHRILDTDRFDTLLSDLSRLANDQRHGVADHPHRVAHRGQKMFATAVPLQAVVAGDVGGGEDPCDPSHALRRPGIDVDNSCVRMRAPHQGRVQQAGHVDVLNVPGPAGHLVHCVHADLGTAQDRLLFKKPGWIAAHRRSGHLDRRNDLGVAGAPAQVALKRLHDLLWTRVWLRPQ